MTRILLTNDDGIDSPGLTALRRVLEPLGEVITIAPEGNRSAIARAITLRRTLYARRVTFGDGWAGFALDGTPVDCVRAATMGSLCPAPDVVVAGINLGPNMGADVTYSGTVGAALEAALLGLPGVAVSIMSREPRHLDEAAVAAASIVARVCDAGLPSGIALNVNLPDLPAASMAGVRVVRLGHAVYDDHVVVEDGDCDGQRYRVESEMTVGENDERTDFGAVGAGWVALTPLRTDWFDEASSSVFADWCLDTATGAGDLGLLDTLS